MTQGYVQSAWTIFFTEHPHKVLFAPKKGEVTLSVKNSTSPTCTAHHCPACKKVVIDYK